MRMVVSTLAGIAGTGAQQARGAKGLAKHTVFLYSTRTFRWGRPGRPPGVRPRRQPGRR
ncbi:exported hypothetical protein [Cupriavidus taiwanensis]|uniref:Uncharacterized protein n=1 Tax=Cupriavidus taiwanensis TaxID=164546 RepID=A0A375E457_9BURK|nr:exported hypothetical protein [Cupriavidus taiwanensis]SOZ27471.1 exported hypothetical protein [Cupriavidus taiwanensis]SOZ60616.1 exported hypothetical protein [Cupriavidus taiwanensis]SOZ64139.1 exported hypothetical protein [Cupriavidus taiwanensis]SOZ99799.1 exported hypothetical protein [Cupriavidus taiwanensis]